MAAWMFGLVFMVFGLESLMLAVDGRIKEGFSIGVVLEAFLAIAILAVGIRIFRNGFPRHAKPAPK
jgi:hypothetical protein